VRTDPVGVVLKAGRQHHDTRPKHAQLKQTPLSRAELLAVPVRNRNQRGRRLLVAGGQESQHKRLPRVAVGPVDPMVHHAVRDKLEVVRAHPNTCLANLLGGIRDRFDR
jgi:hypothetical protein